MGIIKRLFQKHTIKNYQTNKDFKKMLNEIDGVKYRKRQERNSKYDERTGN